jgi:phosphonate degradation associated HDIG domain protein
MILDDVRALFDEHGSKPYSDEAITQLEHALQTAALAEEHGASDSLIAAALLHDLGHMVAAPARVDPKSTDDLHQFRALPLLRAEFPDSVTEPIRLHVDAKRYLCAIDARYLSNLSPVSVNSLRLQGGVFSTAEADRFSALPYALDGVSLRRWDDAAKVQGRTTPDLEHFLAYAHRVMQKRI